MSHARGTISLFCFQVISPEQISKSNSCAFHNFLMSRVRETTLTFFVTYLSPLKPKACAAKFDFWTGFFKNLSFKIAMSRPAGVGSPEV